MIIRIIVSVKMNVFFPLIQKCVLLTSIASCSTLITFFLLLSNYLAYNHSYIQQIDGFINFFTMVLMFKFSHPIYSKICGKLQKCIFKQGPSTILQKMTSTSKEMIVSTSTTPTSVTKEEIDFVE